MGPSWEGEQHVIRQNSSSTIRLSAGLPITAALPVFTAKRSRSALRASQRFLQATLDAIAARIAVLDAAGTILAVNAAWRHFGESNRHTRAAYGVGLSYLQVCDAADDDRTIAAIKAGLKMVLTGAQPEFTLEYPCHSPDEQRWFLLRITSVAGPDSIRAVVQHENITALRQADQAVSYLASIVESSHDAIIGLTLDGTILSWNEGAWQQYGYVAAEMVGRSIGLLIPPGRPDEMTKLLARVAQGDRIDQYENLRARKDGTLIDVSITLSPMIDASGQIVGASSIGRNITRRKQIEQALQESEERYRRLVELSTEAISVNREGRCIYINAAGLQLLGATSPEEIVGQPVTQFIHPDFRDLVLARLQQIEQSGISAPLTELQFLRVDGSIVDVEVTSTAICYGRQPATLTFAHDNTARKRAHARLVHDAFHDALTGLPNRSLFLDRLHHLIARAQRGQAHYFAVLFLDLDRFKRINDSLGHLCGDQLLMDVARRLKASVRPGDTVARLGGDEFAILVEDLDHTGTASAVADRIHQALAAPFFLDGHEVTTSASIGIASSATGYTRAADLLRDADIALYRAKALGRARHEVFDTQMHERIITQLRLETDLRRAIEREEFEVHYQPIVSSTGGAVLGLEALVRWQHPERGLVAPDEFIPLAEETGLIVPLERWVLQTACQQVGAWRATDLPSLFVTVNLSARQLKQPDLGTLVAQTLQAAGIDGPRLHLELTETTVMEDAEQAIATLQKLAALGIHISVDDFGTGYSSLSYLKRLPITTVKIDRSFVSDIVTDPSDAAIVTAILALARSLQLQVVAEGVETEEQYAFLRAQGCDMAQGYLFSEPVPAHEIARLIERWPEADEHNKNHERAVG